MLSLLTGSGATRVIRWALTAGAVVAALVPSTAQAGFGPLPPPNPATAANGAATMHGDSASSDSTPLAGPGPGAVLPLFQELGAACPSILVGADQMPVALCTSIATRAPVLFLLDPATGAPLATLDLPKGNLFGGVYAYLDAADRMVLVDADGRLQRIAHRRASGGAWQLAVVETLDLAPALRARCSDLCGGVVGLAPDWRRRVWFATANGTAGVADPSTRRVQTIALGSGEQVANSISTAPGGTAIATDHALYYLAAGPAGIPRVVWRAPYDRGPARKPGQLSHGTGATPTFFGPEDGTRYLAITDNASPNEHLLVYDTRARRARRPRLKVARLVCDAPVFAAGGGTENSPIGSGRSVFVASTYGYPYPAAPDGAEPAQPASAPFAGGLVRIDLRPDGRGCDKRWEIPLRSAAVPRLSLADGLIYTVERTGALQPSSTTPADDYGLAVIDAATGAVRARQTIGVGLPADTLQTAGTIAPGNVLYQGTISGLFRIARRPGA
jgi:hypothetical protein